MKKTLPDQTVAITARRSGDTYLARAGKGGYARTASSTNSPYNAALGAAAKYFACPESHIILTFESDANDVIKFQAGAHRKPVTILDIEFEDKGQDFTDWQIVAETGQVVNCTPFQYTTWAKCRVIDARKLEPGKRPVIEFPDGERLTLNYAIVRIETKAAALARIEKALATRMTVIDERVPVARVDLKKLSMPKPSGVGINPIISDLDGTFKHGAWPAGIAAAIITNDLRAAFTDGDGGVTLAEIGEAVRFVYTHIPTGKVQEWRRKLGKGGAK